MAKTNNKGFSLIEIVIAIAILSILLTPILKQFASTLETSRKAKALQSANEKAMYEVEEFQSFSKEDLDAKYGAPEETEIHLELYGVDGKRLPGKQDEKGNNIDLVYTAYKYTLPDSVIGAKKDKYSNVVFLDDMSSKVRAYMDETAPEHYKIAYGLTNEDLQKFPAPEGEAKFVLTNEGSIVKYNEKGIVVAVACESSADVDYVADANAVNLGNMHDLDKDTVAMIMGGTSNFDSEAFSALFSKAMDHLRELDYDSWQQALLNVDNESILSTDTLSSSDRLIKIYTDKDAAGKYLVRVDVYYNYNYRLQVTDKDGVTKSNDYNDVVSYTIFSQKFNTKEPPEIYFEYQPYCISSSGEAIRYKADDYFLFDNHVDGCKLYLYKPYKDQMNSQADESTYWNEKGEYYTYYTDNSKTRKVKLHLASKTANKDYIINQKDQQVDDSGDVVSNPFPRMYLYTNLDITGYQDAETDDVQFVSDSYDDLFQYVMGKEDEEQNKVTSSDDTSKTYTKYPLGNIYTYKEVDADNNEKIKEDEEGNKIQPTQRILYGIKEDKREEERLYTITVNLEPDKTSLNTVRLSGAKGVN